MEINLPKKKKLKSCGPIISTSWITAGLPVNQNPQRAVLVMKNLPKAYDPVSVDKNAHGPLSVHVDGGFEGNPFISIQPNWNLAVWMAPGIPSQQK